LIFLAAVFVPLVSVFSAEAAKTADFRAEDDFYEYVNAEWLAGAEIKADRSRLSSFSEAADKINELLMDDLDALAASDEKTGDPMLDMTIEYYRLIANFAKRDADGFSPARRDFQRIDELESLDDLSSRANRFLLDGLPLPFSLYVTTDMADVTRHVLEASMPGTFLPDQGYYEPDSEVGARLLPLVRRMLEALFRAAGTDAKDARLETERALAFDALIGAKMPSAEEKAVVTTYYNPTSYDVFLNKGGAFDFASMIRRLILDEPREVNVAHVAYFDALGEICSEDNFEMMKSWLKAKFLTGAAHFLGRDFLRPVLRYQADASGAEVLPKIREVVYDTVMGYFEDAVGIYYGRKYLGPDAKERVLRMVRGETDVYRKRLTKNDWLGEEARRTAIRKLDTMDVRVGYPDKYPPEYDFYKLTPARARGTLYGNRMALRGAVIRHNFSLYGTKPDRTLWAMPAHEVNAYYKFNDNSVNFPAGILTSPFFSPESSDVANLGGIGTLIGHEISHAFDNNGARFDENGNMKNWWTESDASEFEKRTEAMVKLFDGIEYAGGVVNGRVTLSENIADAGGISCALDVAMSRSGAKRGDLLEFFETYARIWRLKIRPEAALRLLTEDVHAPGSLRVNVQLSNNDDFQEVYGLRETDEMYLAPEKRVKIW
jgi:putative endopeptidase